ncbi:hypothetical protein [uncultured Parolsenella sp.]|uniref:hypothetical protein n=1 Tax=uncultured Parolsenella sp. TaxID=2083008 RepID=UPI0027D9AE40|nr:hypothetical protein [uncultured Parolsenella sp.]
MHNYWRGKAGKTLARSWASRRLRNPRAWEGGSGLPDELEEDFFHFATTHSFLGYIRYWLERQHGLDVDGFSKLVMLVSHPGLLVGHEGDRSNG